MNKLFFTLCAPMLIGTQLWAMQLDTPIGFTAEFVKNNAAAFNVDQLVANLDVTASKDQRWYATLALALLGESCPEIMAPYLSKWAEKIKNINADHVFPSYISPDEADFIELGAKSFDGGTGYFRQPAFAVGRAVKHVLVIKDCKEIKVEEVWVVIAGSGELALRNKVIVGADQPDWNVELLFPGVVVKIPFGTAFQFRAGENGFLIHCLVTPPWPGAQAADNTVEGYWKN